MHNNKIRVWGKTRFRSDKYIRAKHNLPLKLRLPHTVTREAKRKVFGFIFFKLQRLRVLFI